MGLKYAICVGEPAGVLLQDFESLPSAQLDQHGAFSLIDFQLQCLHRIQEVQDELVCCGQVGLVPNGAMHREVVGVACEELLDSVPAKSVDEAMQEPTRQHGK